MSEAGLCRVADQPGVGQPDVDDAHFLKAARRAVRLHPHSEFAWYGLGSFYGDNRCRFYSLKKAAHAYRKSIKINPSNSWVWCKLALVLVGQHQYKRAIAAWGEALRFDPDNETGAWNLRFDLLSQYSE